MISIITASIVYTATLIGCPTGDTCTIMYNGERETIRFADFVVPQRTSKCKEERAMASTTAMVTAAYMRQVGKVYSELGRNNAGNILVTAPDLKQHFIKFDYARELDDTKGWCND